MLLSLYSYFRFCFRHIQTYSSIIQEHTHAYSEPCLFLVYSEPWYIFITDHIQTPRYIHNTILNIFHKSSILVVWYSSEYAFLLKMLYFTVFLTLYFRHILACSRFIQPYLVLLRHIRNPSILKNILLQRYSGIFQTLHIIFRQIQRYLGPQLI